MGRGPWQAIVHEAVELDMTDHHKVPHEKFINFLRDFKELLKTTFGDFPGGPVAKTSCSKCRGPKFDPWARN